MKIIVLALFTILFVISGSFVTAFMFIKYGDSWEYRHFNDKEDKK